MFSIKESRKKKGQLRMIKNMDVIGEKSVLHFVH